MQIQMRAYNLVYKLQLQQLKPVSPPDIMEIWYDTAHKNEFSKQAQTFKLDFNFTNPDSY